VIVTITPADPPSLPPSTANGDADVSGGAVPLPQPPPLLPMPLLDRLRCSFQERSEAAVRLLGVASGAVSFVLCGAVPLVHAFSHASACRHQHSGTVVPSAGLAAEWAEHVNAFISARAPVGRSLRLSHFRLHLHEFAAAYNASLNDDTPRLLLQTVIKRLQERAAAARALCDARREHGVLVTDAELQAAMAARVRAPATDEERYGAARLKEQVGLLKARSDCAALYNAINVAMEYGAHLTLTNTALGMPLPDTVWSDRVNTLFLTMVHASADLRALASRRRITDTAKAMAIHHGMQRNVRAAETSPANRDGFWIPPEGIILHSMNEARRLATDIKGFRQQIEARGEPCSVAAGCALSEHGLHSDRSLSHFELLPAVCPAAAAKSKLDVSNIRTSLSKAVKELGEQLSVLKGILPLSAVLEAREYAARLPVVGDVRDASSLPARLGPLVFEPGASWCGCG
jgi:hypothetical protein